MPCETRPATRPALPSEAQEFLSLILSERGRGVARAIRRDPQGSRSKNGQEKKEKKKAREKKKKESIPLLLRDLQS